MTRFCKYCGCDSKLFNNHDESVCKEVYHPLYLNDYQMGNLIGLFAMVNKSFLENGDWFGEIPSKLHAWCEEYGFPMIDNYGHKIDQTTWHEFWGQWLLNIEQSTNRRANIKEVHLSDKV